MPCGTKTFTKGDALTAIGSYRAENGSLQLMRGFLFVISALVTGAFFTVWTIQRAPDIAVLKALGASTPYLLRDALGQAVFLLAAGTLLGTGLAAGSRRARAGRRCAVRTGRTGRARTRRRDDRSRGARRGSVRPADHRRRPADRAGERPMRTPETAR